MLYRRMLKISWTDKVTNDAVLAKMKESKLHFADSIMKQKLSYALRRTCTEGGDQVEKMLC